MLNIASYSNRDVSEVLDFQRKFVSLKVTFSRWGRFNDRTTKVPEYNERLLKVFEHVGASITHFSLEHAQLNRHDLTSIFGSMPELITIILDEVDIKSSVRISGDSQQGQESPVPLKKLKTLKASYTTWSLLEIMQAPNLTYLSINGLNQDFYPTSFIRFIETAASLQTLAIRSPYEKGIRCGNAPSSFCKNFAVFYETLGSIDSQLLPRLETLEIGAFTRASWDPFCKFISKQSDTLTKVTLDWGFTKDQPKEAFAKVFQIVFGDLKILNELTIGSVLKDCPNDASVFDYLNLNNSIKSLRLGVYDFSQNVFERVLGICTELEALEIRELTEEKARFMADNMKLTKLTVQGIHFFNIIFPTLKVLEVLDLRNSQWQNFLKINSTIQTLIACERVESGTLHILINFIVDETNVKHLTIRAYGPISLDVYKKIEENPKWLQTLEWIYTPRFTNHRLFLKLPIKRDLNWQSSNKSKKVKLQQKD